MQQKSDAMRRSFLMAKIVVYTIEQVKGKRLNRWQHGI